MAVRSGRLFSLLKLIGGLENCSLYGVERWPFYSMWLLFGGGSTVIILYILQGFREGKYQVLVATDVAARGLDIPEVDLVVQCEPPKVRVHV